MLVRLLTDADAAAYWELRLEALITEPTAFGQTIEQHRSTTIDSAANYLRTQAAGSFVLGVLDAETLAGTLRFVREEGSKERHKGSLRSLFLKPSYRRQGLGRLLVAEALRLARLDPELEQISLTVTSTQLAAIALYRSFGFQLYGTEPRSLRVDGQYVDEHHLILLSEH